MSEEVIKRKRGRPKKEKPVDENAAPVKRKIGRPKNTGENIKKTVMKKPDGRSNAQIILEAKQERANLAKVSEIRETVDLKIEDDFHVNLPTYVQERQEKFTQLLAKCDVSNDVIIDTTTGKVAHYELNKLLSQPLIFGGVPVAKLSASEIAMCADCYWDCVERLTPMDKDYVPTIQKFCRLLGLSTTAFLHYKDSNDMATREAVLMIYDRFTDYYQSKGLKGELEKLNVMFTLKAQYGWRDNDAPQTVVNNNFHTEVHTDLDEIERRYGLSDYKPTIDVEV